MNIGFSTGSLAKGNYELALDMLTNSNSNVVEISSLRESELERIISSFDELFLKKYKYISFHAPSKLKVYSELQLVNQLKKITKKNIYIIVHPDIICDFSLWQSFGSLLCIENMDMRKAIGRTTQDLAEIFYHLPNASFCFDLAHVRQVDPTMIEALDMVKKFGEKIKQLHISVVNSKSLHESLTLEAIIDYRKIAKYINKDTPIILESPIHRSRVNAEIELASLIFDNNKFSHSLTELGAYINSNTGFLQTI